MMEPSEAQQIIELLKEISDKLDRLYLVGPGQGNPIIPGTFVHYGCGFNDGWTYDEYTDHTGNTFEILRKR